jgi:hypothetical protein
MGRDVFTILRTDGTSSGGSTPAFCTPTGGPCLSFDLLPEGGGPFVAPGPESVLHDASLDELVDNLNTLIKGKGNLREDKKQTLGFVETDRGIVVVWKAKLTKSEKASISSADILYDSDNRSDVELARILDIESGR